MNAVAIYCDNYKASGLTPEAYARHMLAYHLQRCLDVLDTIGSWPSSEPELAALQRLYR